MDILLYNCSRYWKLEFNLSKSVSYSIGSKISFKLNGVKIPSSNGFIYLGLPIGDEKFISSFFNEKITWVEKSLYSLKGLGYENSVHKPRTIVFPYKQYCKSIIKFGFENLFVNSTNLRHLKVRQNVLDSEVWLIFWNEFDLFIT